MGLNPENRKVIKYSREDEESRYAAFAKLGEDGKIRAGSIAEMERRMSVGSVERMNARLGNEKEATPTYSE